MWILINLWRHFLRNWEIIFSVIALVFTVALTYLACDSHYTILQLACSQTHKLVYLQTRSTPLYPPPPTPRWKGEFDGFWEMVSSTKKILPHYADGAPRLNWFRCHHTGTGYCFVGLDWFIDFLNKPISRSVTSLNIEKNRRSFLFIKNENLNLSCLVKTIK